MGVGLAAEHRRPRPPAPSLLVAFVLVERRAAEPVLPLWVFRRAAARDDQPRRRVGVGAILIGLTSYVPTYVQGVLGTGPLVAGFALAALTLGWPIVGVAVRPGLPADRLPVRPR